MVGSIDRGGITNLFKRLTSQPAGVRHLRLGLWPTFQATKQSLVIAEESPIVARTFSKPSASF